MFDAHSRDRDKDAGSLLSFGSSTPDGRGAARPRPFADEPEPAGDAAARHRLARSRREAVPSPLLSALADADRREAVEKATAATVPAAPGTGQPTPAIADSGSGGLRALIRERLLGRSPADDRTPTSAVSGMSADARSSDAGAARPGAPALGPSSDGGHDAADGRADDIWRPLIDPVRVIMGIVNSKALIASTAMLGALLGVAIALSTPKKYEAAAELLVDPRDLKLVDRDLTQVGLPSDATLAIVENQVRVLTSGSVLNKVVDKLNLADDPEFNGEGAGGLGVLSDLRSLLSRRDASAGGDRRRALAVEHLAESLSVERGGKTFVIVVAAKTRDPEKSALIANTMTDVFLQTYGDLQSGTAGRATDELNARLDELRAGVEAAERKVEAYKAENDLVDAQGRLISDDEIVKLNEQLSIARARTMELNAKAASSRDVDVHDALGGGLPEELNSNVMTELRSQYAALKQEADRISVRLGPRHPERLAADAQLDGARGRIANELRRIVTSTQTELKRAVQLEQELSARLAQLKVRQGSVSDDLVALRELEREAAAKRSVYESYLLRAKETGEQKGINTANMSVISQAFAPLVPLGPSRSTIVLTGVMLGFMGGVGLGGARGAWHSLRENTRPRRSRRTKPEASAQPDASLPEPPEPKDPARRPPPRASHLADDAPPPPPRHPAATPPDGTRAPGWAGGLGPARAGEEAAYGYAVPPHAPAAAPRGQPMEHLHPQQPAYAQPAMPRQPAYPQAVMPQQAIYPQHFVPVQAQPPLPAYAPLPYPAMPYPGAPQVWPPAPQAWPPMQQVFPQPAPAAHPVAYSPQFVAMMPVQAAHQSYPVYPQQPLFQQPMPAVAPGVGGYAQPPSTDAPRPRGPSSPIEDVRDSLRDFREAVRDVAERRSRRRAG